MPPRTRASRRRSPTPSGQSATPPSQSPSPSSPVNKRRKRGKSPTPSEQSTTPPSLSPSPSPPEKKRRKRGKKCLKKRIKVIGNVSGDAVQIGFQNSYKKPTTGKARERELSSEGEIVGDNVIEVIDEDVVDEAQVLPLALLNKHYLLATEIFTESRLADGKIPQIVPEICEVEGCQEKNCVELEFYTYYIGNALRNLLNIGRIHELREGWSDSSIWCYFIDSLFSKSEVLTLLRKEVGIITRGHSERFDGIFRYLNGVKRFDLGVVKVGPPFNYPDSDLKPNVDRAKILWALTTLLGQYHKVNTPEPVQLIGVLCSGWTITISRMWYHAKSSTCRVQDRKFAIRTDAKNLHKNLEVIEALVQASDIMIKSALLLSGGSGAGCGNES